MFLAFIFSWIHGNALGYWDILLILLICAPVSQVMTANSILSNQNNQHTQLLLGQTDLDGATLPSTGTKAAKEQTK